MTDAADIFQPRIGFVGAGGWGLGKHLPAIRHISERRLEGFEPVLTHLAEADPDHREKVARDWGFERASADVAALAADPDLDAFVVVVNPARLAGVLPPLADTGKPIFCEKPPGASPAEARRYADRIPQPHLVAFNRRFHPLVDRLKRELDVVSLHAFQASMFRHGRLDSFRSRSDSSVPAFFRATSIHLIDTLRSLLGDLTMEHIHSTETRPGITDGRVCSLKTVEKGIHGQLAVLPTCGWNEERIELHAADTSYRLEIRFEGEPSRLRILRKGSLELDLVEETGRGNLWCEGYIPEHLEFLRAVRDGRPSRSTFASGADSLALAEQLELAAPPPRPGGRACTPCQSAKAS